MHERTAADHEQDVANAEDVGDRHAGRNGKEVSQNGKVGIFDDGGVPECLVVDRKACGSERAFASGHDAAVRRNRRRFKSPPRTMTAIPLTVRFIQTNASAGA